MLTGNGRQLSAELLFTSCFTNACTPVSVSYIDINSIDFGFSQERISFRAIMCSRLLKQQTTSNAAVPCPAAMYNKCSKVLLQYCFSHRF